MGDTVKFIRDQLNNVHNIGFLATQDASAGANDLDDYEEGSWTPALADNSGDGSGESQTYGGQTGRYTKIGNRVFISCDLTLTSIGSLTGAQGARIVGLPFTSNATSGVVGSIAGIGFDVAIGADQSISGYIADNKAHISLYLWDATTGTTILTVTEWSATGRLILTGSYQV
jgi:hypothetical protein